MIQPGFTKILKLILKLRHIILVFVTHEIMLKFVFSKVISCETKKSTSEFMLKLKLKLKFVNSIVYDFVTLFVNIHTWRTCIQVHLNNCMYPNVQINYPF